MKKLQKEKPNNKTIWPSFSAIKKTMIGLGVLGLLGVLADVFDVISFFKPDDPALTNQTTIYNQDNSTNQTTYNVQPNFINNITYNCDIKKEIVEYSSGVNIEINDKIKSDMISASEKLCNNQLDLAFDIMSTYESPPSGVNPVGFYTLKGNTLFFKKEYDLSYQNLLMAFNLDKNSKYLDLPKLRGLTYAHAHLRMSGYTLKDLKNIEMPSRDKIIYDLGFKKIELPNGWILIHEDTTKEDRELLNLMQDLKMNKSY